MHRTRAQASFAAAIGSSLREVAEAVDESLEAASKRTTLFSSTLLAYDRQVICTHLPREAAFLTIPLELRTSGVIVSLNSPS